MPWAAHFARNCPEPDFAGAREHLWQYRANALREALTDYRWPLTALLLLSATLAGGLYRRRQLKLKPVARLGENVASDG